MGSAHSKQANNTNKSTTTGKLKAKARSRKRTKLSGAFGRSNIKHQKTESLSNHPSSPPLPTSPPVSSHKAHGQQQEQEQPVDYTDEDLMPPLPSLPALPQSLPPPLSSSPSPQSDTDNNDSKRISMDVEEDNDDGDEILPLSPMRNATNGNESNHANDRWNKRRTRNSSRSSRPISTLSCASDSGLQSGTSSGWTFSGGLFSHIDTNASSTITAITDFSTISKGSVLDWPDDYNCHKKRKSPPPYCQQQSILTTGAESSTSTTETSASSDQNGDRHGDLICTLAGSSSSTSHSLQDTLLAKLAQSPMSSFRLFRDAFTTCSTATDMDSNGSLSSSEETIFKAAEIWYQQTNDTVAQVWMARCMIEGWGTSLDPALGFTRLKALADHGCWEAYYPLAHYYLQGIRSTPPILADETPSTSDSPVTQPVDHAAAYQWFLATVEPHQQPHCVLAQDQQVVSEMVSLAQYRLGTILFYGLGMTEQPEQAFHWFEKSATLGNRYAQFIVGLHYEKGTVVNQDVEKAKDYYLSSAKQGFVDSQAALGIHLIDQDQLQQGIHWLKQAIQSNNTRALLKFGMMHETGHGVSQDYEKAVHHYKMAANQDDPVAHYVLGVHYLFGQVLLEQNHQEAGKHLTRSARAGFAPSQRIVGLMYAQGLLSTIEGDHHHQQQQRRKDEKTALVWFRRAASHGDVRALGLVGYSYEYGHGAAVNFDIALQYYQKAARISSPFQCSAQVAVATLLHRMNRLHDALDWFQRASAYESLMLDDDSLPGETTGTTINKETHRSRRAATLMVARYRLHGWTGSKDPGAAFEILDRLTRNNTADGHAHYWMAACFEEGIPGVCDQNLGKAYHHYHIAAVAGDTDAQFQVAFMLSNGKGVAKDRSEAFQWYNKAAKNGHKTALYSLGLYYVKGLDGVTKDLEMAGECFEKAAQLGMVTAMTSLASLYRMLVNETLAERSDGDPTISYYREQIVFWYRKAAALGDSSAQRELGIFYNAGLFGVTQDHAMALDLLSKASRQEDAQATLLLASYHQNGVVVDKDDDQAIQLYLHASSLGSPVAHFAAAQLYHNLHHYEKAYAQYRLASNHSQLQRTKIGRISRLMVARYILSYIAGSPSLDKATIIHSDAEPMSMEYTKADAFKMLENLAVLDRFESSFYWLADCYFTGNGTSISYHDALYWFRRSADEINDKDSMYKVAQMFENGLGVEADLVMALQYNQKSANLGHIEAQHQLGMAFWRGYYNLEINLNMAVQWFTKSATQRYNESHWALGQLAIENDDLEMAVAWWQKATDLGHVVSMRLLATLLLQQSSSPITTSVDVDRAVQLLADASRLGDVESLVLLGQVHQAGMVTSSLRAKLSSHQQQEEALYSPASSLRGGTSIMNSDGEEEIVMNEEETQLLQRQQEEQELATRCFEQAAYLGHVEGMFLAGQSWHTQQQYAAAFEFYNQAAQHGHTLSRVMRARYRLAGLGGISIDKEDGFQELLECAETDQCVEAYNSLGQCYEMGFGTQADAVCAYQWYLRSAETTTDAEAMYRIGQLYIENRLDCAESNIEAAFRWYQLADQASGHVRANYQLGLYYLTTGSEQQKQPPRDPMVILSLKQRTLAMTHLRNAATQGDKDAMYELGYLCLSTHADGDDDGFCSSSSLECQMNGYYWMTRAAEQGSLQAQCELAMLYHSGHEVQHADETAIVVEQDFEKAYDLFCQAARQGDVTATIYIGTYYEHGIHVAPSTELAKEWYQDAIELASSSSTDGNNKNGSMLWLAELGLARLWHQEKASIEAFDMFCSAYRHGPRLGDQQESTLDTSSSSAMSLCKIMMMRYQLYGWGGVTKDCAMAAQELLRMAETGHSKVFLDVAQCYENGTGLILDHINAYTWYGRIVALANSKSTDSDEDDEDDEDLWDDEDEQDHATALFKLAEFYRLGYTPDGQADHDKSVSLYYLAADKGSEEAQHHIQSFLI